jgi:hypothetical protein
MAGTDHEQPFRDQRLVALRELLGSQVEREQARIFCRKTAASDSPVCAMHAPSPLPISSLAFDSPSAISSSARRRARNWSKSLSIAFSPGFCPGRDQSFSTIPTLLCGM